MSKQSYCSENIINSFEIFVKCFIQLPQRMKEQFNVCSDMDECLNRLTSNRNGVAISRKRIESSQLFLSNKIHCFDKTQNIHNYSIGLNVRKNFEHITEVNDIISKMLESGLIQKWENDEYSTQSLNKLNNFNSNPNSQLSNIIVFAIALCLVALVISAEFIAKQP